MAKSFIGLAEGQKVRGIFSSWEPYDKNTAHILLEHYQDVEKLRELILIGDILFLEKDIKKIQKPVAFISEETTFQSVASAIKNCWNHFHAEYCYIYFDGYWMAFTCKPECFTQPDAKLEEIPDPPEDFQSNYSIFFDKK